MSKSPLTLEFIQDCMKIDAGIHSVSWARREYNARKEAWYTWAMRSTIESLKGAGATNNLDDYDDTLHDRFCMRGVTLEGTHMICSVYHDGDYNIESEK